jgi:hypothetical protein
MSQAEVLRFYSDIKIDPALSEELRSGAQGLGQIVDKANDVGYEFTIDELKRHIVESSGGSLSDEQIAKISAAGSTFSVVIGPTTSVVIDAVVVLGPTVTVVVIL